MREPMIWLTWEPLWLSWIYAKLVVLVHWSLRGLWTLSPMGMTAPPRQRRREWSAVV